MSSMLIPSLDLQSGEQSYWRDVGTIDAYWSANMELIGGKPGFKFVMYKNLAYMDLSGTNASAKFVFDNDDRRGQAVDSMVSGAV